MVEVGGREWHTHVCMCVFQQINLGFAGKKKKSVLIIRFYRAIVFYNCHLRTQESNSLDGL